MRHSWSPLGRRAYNAAMQFPSLRRGFETLVRTAPVDEVTRRGDEVEARAAGLQPADVDAIWRAAVGVYNSGLYPAVQLCLRRAGQVVIDRSIGHASGN